mmetsp:Transcript_45649/g.109356  ORF Transcript_45649/g.109356 Transcript_45649/m.109356 type:complete len:308 (-) Transcript_45649:770-1693(-)
MHAGTGHHGRMPSPSLLEREDSVAIRDCEHAWGEGGARTREGSARAEGGDLGLFVNGAVGVGVEDAVNTAVLVPEVDRPIGADRWRAEGVRQAEGPRSHPEASAEAYVVACRVPLPVLRQLVLPARCARLSVQHDDRARVDRRPREDQGDQHERGGHHQREPGARGAHGLPAVVPRAALAQLPEAKEKRERRCEHHREDGEGEEEDEAGEGGLLADGRHDREAPRARHPAHRQEGVRGPVEGPAPELPPVGEPVGNNASLTECRLQEHDAALHYRPQGRDGVHHAVWSQHQRAVAPRVRAAPILPQQ